MNATLKKVLGYSLAASLAIAPAAAFAKENGKHVGHPHIAHADRGKAFGHLFAPGFVRNFGRATTTATSTLPFGIRLNLERRHETTSTSTFPVNHMHRHATTTPENE